MIGIREHGGIFGAGKYRKGLKLTPDIFNLNQPFIKSAINHTTYDDNGQKIAINNNDEIFAIVDGDSDTRSSAIVKYTLQGHEIGRRTFSSLFRPNMKMIDDDTIFVFGVSSLTAGMYVLDSNLNTKWYFTASDAGDFYYKDNQFFSMTSSGGICLLAPGTNGGVGTYVWRDNSYHRDSKLVVCGKKLVSFRRSGSSFYLKILNKDTGEVLLPETKLNGITAQPYYYLIEDRINENFYIIVGATASSATIYYIDPNTLTILWTKTVNNNFHGLTIDGKIVHLSPLNQVEIMDHLGNTTPFFKNGLSNPNPKSFYQKNENEYIFLFTNTAITYMDSLTLS